MKYDYLIVGSGLYGSAFAHCATKHGKRCLVIDKRPHLGGNLYCDKVEDINVHKYGPHIFHTSNKEVWTFVNSIEHKHFEAFAADVEKNPKTVISREYSVEWEEGMEPYYPINDDKNIAVFEKYQELAQKETNVIFGGRLAEYKYYDMAPIVEKVMGLFE